MRLLLVLAWYVFIASASFWLPAYQGYTDGEEVGLMFVYAVVAALTAVAVRGRGQSVDEAVVSALPAVGILAGAAVLGYLMNEQSAEYRGSPLYLYFGVALWASWGVLVLLSALVSRTKWNGIAGIVLSFVVAVFGLFLFSARID